MFEYTIDDYVTTKVPNPNKYHLPLPWARTEEQQIKLEKQELSKKMKKIRKHRLKRGEILTRAVVLWNPKVLIPHVISTTKRKAIIRAIFRLTFLALFVTFGLIVYILMKKSRSVNYCLFFYTTQGIGMVCIAILFLCIFILIPRCCRTFAMGFRGCTCCRWLIYALTISAVTIGACYLTMSNYAYDCIYFAIITSLITAFVCIAFLSSSRCCCNLTRKRCCLILTGLLFLAIFVTKEVLQICETQFGVYSKIWEKFEVHGIPIFEGFLDFVDSKLGFEWHDKGMEWVKTQDFQTIFIQFSYSLMVIIILFFICYDCQLVRSRHTYEYHPAAFILAGLFIYLEIVFLYVMILEWSQEFYDWWFPYKKRVQRNILRGQCFGALYQVEEYYPVVTRSAESVSERWVHYRK